MTARRILSNIRVLDFTHALAGPTTTRLMAEMGADIIKVELAPRGDMTRAMSYYKDGRSGYFIQQNRGKKSLCLDLRKPAAVDIVKRLVADTEALLEAVSLGRAARKSANLKVRQPLSVAKVILADTKLADRLQPYLDMMKDEHFRSRGLFGKPRNDAKVEELLKRLSLWDKRKTIMESDIVQARARVS